MVCALEEMGAWRCVGGCLLIAFALFLSSSVFLVTSSAVAGLDLSIDSPMLSDLFFDFVWCSIISSWFRPSTPCSFVLWFSYVLVLVWLVPSILLSFHDVLFPIGMILVQFLCYSIFYLCYLRCLPEAQLPPRRSHCSHCSKQVCSALPNAQQGAV